jgi:hypothetical protein
VVGIVGLFNGLTTDPANSAVRQTVNALWVLQGLVGLVIFAIGVIGGSIVQTLKR